MLSLIMKLKWGDMKTVSLVVFVLIYFAAATASAQDLQGVGPAGIQKHSGDLQEYYRLEKMLKEKATSDEKPQIEDETLAAPVEKGGDEARIVIKAIVTDKSEILSAAEINGITAGYEGKAHSIQDLFAIVDKLNALYRSKGFITAKALLPPQKVEGGVVRIRLVEGRVGKVQVEGNAHTRESFFRHRFSLHKGDLVRLDTLEKDLVYFNAVNDVRVRATLRPGEMSGETDLVLKAAEPSNYEVSILTDNAGTETIGKERLGLKFGDYSLFGYRDPLTLSGYLSEGSRTVSAEYSFPINALGTRLSASYGFNQVDIQSGPFADLDVGGDSYSYNFNLNHPLIFGPAFTMNLFAGYQFSSSTTDFAGVTIARSKIGAVPVGFDFRLLDDHGLWYCRTLFSPGRERSDVNESFLRYNLDLVRTLIHTSEVYTTIRAKVQLSDSHPLASSEQFQVGGLSSVRGFPEGFLVGDEGYFLSAEIKFPLPYTDRELFGTSLRKMLRGAFFIDHGAAFPYRGSASSSTHEDFITSAGVGLSMDIAHRLTGRVDVGFPFQKHRKDIDSFQLHFTLQLLAF